MSTLHPQVEEYLARFDVASLVVPQPRRDELRAEIEGHLRDAVPVDASDRDAATAISDFGTPVEIIRHEASVVVTPRRPRRRLIVAAIAIPLALAIAVIAFVLVRTVGVEPSIVTQHPVGVDRVDEGQAYEEYLAGIAKLPPLPEGADYPSGVPVGLDAGPVDAGPGAIMESGAGYTIAHFTWLCAWETEYVTAFDGGDARRIVAAEAALKKFPETAFYEDWDSDGAWYKVVVLPIALGDSSGAKADRFESCFQAGITVPRG